MKLGETRALSKVVVRCMKNPRWLVVYVKNIIDKPVEEIVIEVEEIMWIGIKDKLALSIKMCVGFLYCPQVNLKWFDVNFIRDMNEEISVLRDKYSNAEFLMRVILIVEWEMNK